MPVADERAYQRFWFSFDDLIISPGIHATGEMSVCCPFHSDSAPSMSVNINTGLWYCHSCQIGGGAADFVIKKAAAAGEELSKSQAEIEVRSRLGTSHLPSHAQVDSWNEALLATPTVMAYLKRRMVDNEGLLNRYKIGWNGTHITLPVCDETSEIVNVRYMSPYSGGQKLNFPGYGHPPRLWPIDQVSAAATEVIICEGEMDCLTAILQGYNAVTGTGGAGAWNEEWSKQFSGVAVTICYDGDEAGRRGAQRVAASVQPYASRVRIAAMPEGQDINSLFISGISLSSIIEAATVVTEIGPRIILGPELMASAAEELRKPWVVDTLVRPGWLGVLAGHGKSGKTVLVTHMMGALSYGRSFLGLKTSPMDCVYWNYEMSLGELATYYQLSIGSQYDRWPLTLVDPPRPMDPTALGKTLERWIADFNLPAPGMIIIDPARPAFMFRGDAENSASEVGYYLRTILDVCRHTGWTCLVLHHFTKHGTGDPLDAAGSAEWLAAPDMLMTWVKKGKTNKGRLQAIGRMPRVEPLIIDLTPQALLLPYTTTRERDAD